MKWNKLDTSEVITSGDVLQSEDDRFLLIKNLNYNNTNCKGVYYELINLESFNLINKCSKCGGDKFD